jgi:GNAT superfamily N-acetyltransferase
MKDIYTVEVDDDMRPAIADVCFWPDFDAYIIHRINVPLPARGRRHGSDLLTQIIRDADEEGVVLMLAPVPSGGLGADQIVEWYKRYGFRWTRSGAMMERFPT